MSYPSIYEWGMKTQKFYSMTLIPVKAQRRPFLARRGVALLRGWRLKLAKLESERLAQVEFDFAAGRLCRRTLMVNR